MKAAALEQQTLCLNSKDNILIALEALSAGVEVGTGEAICRCEIPPGHKIARRDILPGEAVVKYGQVIGVASEKILSGDHVHTHNVQLVRTDSAAETAADGPIDMKAGPSSLAHATFDGIIRPDGRVATRNFIGIIPMVGCAATVARHIADHYHKDALKPFPQVDDVVAFVHGTGCGMSSSNVGFTYLQRVIAGYANHPNFSGVILVGLGCEVNQISKLVAEMGLGESPRLRTLTIQEAGGTEKAIARGIGMIDEMLPVANQDCRRKTPISKLVIGLECGGSDAYSGITANPALGAAVDILVAQGGTAVLSETTEIYGAEHLLARRAVSEEVRKKLLERISWWERYTATNKDQIDNNPTPGNKAGGLTNIIEKSLGAISKAGSSPLVRVLEYAQSIDTRGLVFMDTPGFDLASITGMTAGGAHLVCFTTGCGTPVGSKPAPSIKLASNTMMFNNMAKDMDIDCGRVLSENISIEAMGRIVFDRIVDTASGRQTKSEKFGYGSCEFVPWQIGAVV